MDFINKILGINWRTSLAGYMAIVAAVGRIAVAYRSRDFAAIFTDAQLIFETVGVLLLAFGLLKAKDSNVTGTGAIAKAVDSEGTVTNVDGVEIGRQTTMIPRL